LVVNGEPPEIGWRADLINGLNTVEVHVTDSSRYFKHVYTFRINRQVLPGIVSWAIRTNGQTNPILVPESEESFYYAAIPFVSSEMNSAFEIEFADGYYGTVYRLLPDGEEELDEGNAFTVPASGFYRFKVELWNSSEDYPASYKLTVKAGEND